jgi:hypothetical protein
MHKTFFVWMRNVVSVIKRKVTLKAFENKLWGAIWTWEGEKTGGWKNITQVKNTLSQNSISMIKCRTVEWTEHIARVGGMIDAYRKWVGSVSGKKRWYFRCRLEYNFVMDHAISSLLAISIGYWWMEWTRTGCLEGGEWLKIGLHVYSNSTQIMYQKMSKFLTRT